MGISAKQLRTARHLSNMTQAELAELLDVSQRTVVNWERDGGSGVPERAEAKVRKLFDLSGVEGVSAGEKEVLLLDNLDFTPQEAPNVGPDAMELERRMWKAIKATPGSDRDAKTIASVAVYGSLVIDFAEAAANSGAHPLNVLDILEGAISAVVETGAVVLPKAFGGEDVVQQVVIRGTDLARRVVDEYVPDGSTTYRVRFDEQRRDLEAKMASVRDVSGSGEDDETARQDEYRLAAKKRSEDRGEVSHD